MRTFRCLSACTGLTLAAACNTTRYQARPSEALNCSPPYLLEATNHTIWAVDVYGPGPGKGTFLGPLEPGETGEFRTASATGLRWVRRDPVMPTGISPADAARNQMGVTFRPSCG